MKNSKAYPLGRLADSGRKLIPSVIFIRALARSTKWFVRTSRAIQAEQLLVSLLAAIAFGERSARAIALELGICSDVNVSRQAVWKRLRLPGVTLFMEGVIGLVLQRSIDDPSLRMLRDSVQAATSSLVRRVLVADASTFTLHPSLAAIFPGAKNGKLFDKAQLKFQLVMDLLSGRWIHFSLDPYSRSDMKAGLDFLPLLNAGDLLIRDLGYACAAAFREIIAAKAFFISRLKASTHVSDRDGRCLDLASTLDRLAPGEGDIVRIPILLSNGSQVPCFLVAQRVPRAVGDERRRKINAKHKRRGINAPTERYLELQDWTILITNLPEEAVANSQVIQWYLMRWRIEMIFKACKSHAGMLKIASHKTNAHHARALVLTWILAMIILAHRGSFATLRARRTKACDPVPQALVLVECSRNSIFKMTARLVRTLGFEIELAGAGLDLAEHHRRLLSACQRHNQTEPVKKRKPLSQILTSALSHMA